jgi:hypothetical protein
VFFLTLPCPAYFLLASPPIRLTEKMIRTLKENGWIDTPNDIGAGLSEYVITTIGRAYATCWHEQESQENRSPRMGLGTL